MRACFVLVLWALLSCVTIDFYGQKSKLTSIIPQKFRNSMWSVSARNSVGKLIVEYNSEALITPASNLKLLTSAALLSELGSEYSPKTFIKLEGNADPNQDSVFYGDVTIYGTGDPGIGYSKDESPFEFFSKIASFLKLKGFSTIQGDVIANISAFDDEMIPGGWEHYDLSFYYAVPISPLAFMRNTFYYNVTTGSIDDERTITTFPEFISDFTIFDKQTVSQSFTKYNEYYRRDLGTYNIHVRSDLPRNYSETEYFSVPDPAEYFLKIAQHQLEENGILVLGEFYSSDESFDKDAADFSIEHKPLKEWLVKINSNSDNFVTEMLTRNAVVVAGKDSVGFKDGIKLVTDFASEIGLDTLSMLLSDVSGLSASNLITTSDLSKMLWKMESHPEFETYIVSLSQRGSEGTLQYRFGSRKWNRQFRGKSGYISGARTLSGYLTTKSGKTISLSIATNHFVDKVSAIDRIQEDIIDWIFNEY